MYNRGNNRYFQTIDTLQKAYYVGLLAADGYIYNYRNTKGFTIDLTLDDAYVLEGLALEIGTNKPLRQYHNDKASYALSCNVKPRKRLTYFDHDTFNDLINLGITPRKTHTIGRVIDNIPEEYKIGFILGYIDGDGSISFGQVWRTKNNWKTKYLQKTCNVQMRGTKELLESIVENLPYSGNSTIKPSSSMYKVAISNRKNAEYLLEYYNKLTYCIKRKPNKIIEFLT